MEGPPAVLMRRQLTGAEPAPAWPDGTRLAPFSEQRAAELHDLLVHAYRNGGGSVGSLEHWHGALTGDAEFDPALCFVVLAGDVAVAAEICWTSAFVKDLVVHESWRRRGLGEALLYQAFRTFGASGAAHVDLKVEATNAPAIRLYERVGMLVVE